MENISRGTAFGDFVTIRIRTEVDAGRPGCKTTEYKRTDSPKDLPLPPFKCNVLRESLSVYSQNIPCATLKRWGFVGNLCISLDETVHTTLSFWQFQLLEYSIQTTVLSQIMHDKRANTLVRLMPSLWLQPMVPAYLQSVPFAKETQIYHIICKFADFLFAELICGSPSFA